MERALLKAHIPFLMASLLVGCSKPVEYDLAVENVSVIDITTGEVLPGRHLGILDGSIEYIGSDPVQAESYLSGSGRWAIPGLWDMHVHISDPSFFPLFIANGIVGVRDMGGAAPAATNGCESINYETLRSWQTDIRTGVLSGPDIVAAGPVVSGTGANSSLDATSPQKARDAVSQVVAMGVDFVKVYEDISLETLRAIASEAETQGVHFAGHVSEETLRTIDAVESGQRSIEHVRANLLLCFADTDEQLQELFVSDQWDADDRQWAARHLETCPELWKKFRSSDIWLTPTLAIQETLETATEEGFEHDPRRDSLPESIRQSVESLSQSLRERSSSESAEVKNWNRYIHKLVGRAIREDVSLLAGSDSACEGTIPGYSLHRELELLVEAGSSSLGALQAATLNPARYLQRESSSGRLDVGFEADIVLLDGNPLDDISNTQLVYAVIIDGGVEFLSSESDQALSLITDKGDARPNEGS